MSGDGDGLSVDWTHEDETSNGHVEVNRQADNAERRRHEASAHE